MNQYVDIKNQHRHTVINDSYDNLVYFGDRELEAYRQNVMAMAPGDGENRSYWNVQINNNLSIYAPTPRWKGFIMSSPNRFECEYLGNNRINGAFRMVYRLPSEKCGIAPLVAIQVPPGYDFRVEWSIGVGHTPPNIQDGVHQQNSFLILYVHKQGRTFSESKESVRQDILALSKGVKVYLFGFVEDLYHGGISYILWGRQEEPKHNGITPVPTIRIGDDACKMQSTSKRKCGLQIFGNHTYMKDERIKEMEKSPYAGDLIYSSDYYYLRVLDHVFYDYSEIFGQNTVAGSFHNYKSGDIFGLHKRAKDYGREIAVVPICTPKIMVSGINVPGKNNTYIAQTLKFSTTTSIETVEYEYLEDDRTGKSYNTSLGERRLSYMVIAIDHLPKKELKAFDIEGMKYV